MLRKHPNDLFVFGDNYQRKGLGGQAAEMRGEPNAVGVITKWLPQRTPTSYFSDRDFKIIIPVLVTDIQTLFDHAANGGQIVWPLDGIGTGLAQLPIRAPKIFDFIESCREVLELAHK